MSGQKFKAVVMGLSAGALDALLAILPKLPADYPLPVLVVVHLVPDRKSILSELLQRKCAVAVQEAEDKEVLQPGIVYLAPPDYHMQVENDGHISLSNDLPVFFSRPSIDVLFETAADAFGDELLGIVLTGASGDGSKGLRAVLDAGGMGIIQTPDTAYSSTMPREARELCPEAQLMTLEGISEFLQKVPSL